VPCQPQSLQGLGQGCQGHFIFSLARAMLTFVMLTCLSPEAARSPKALEELERQAVERMRKECPDVEWVSGYPATLSAIATGSKARFSSDGFASWAFVTGQLRHAHHGRMGMRNG